MGDRPDFIPVFGQLDLVDGVLHLFDRRGRLVGLVRGVELIQAARPSAGPGRSEPAGDSARPK
jgi:hypothetical protein